MAVVAGHPNVLAVVDALPIARAIVATTAMLLVVVIGMLNAIVLAVVLGLTTLVVILTARAMLVAVGLCVGISNAPGGISFFVISLTILG